MGGSCSATWSTARILSLLLITLVIGCERKKQKPSQPFSPDGLVGIDVSNHQGLISWEKVSMIGDRKIEFVYIKATEGSTHVDRRYLHNIRAARKKGILAGSYHYFRTTSEPNDQFRNFIRVADKDSQDLIPVVDVEEMDNWNTVQFHGKFSEFLRLVEDHYGVKPMIYTVNSFYNRHLAGRYRDHKIFVGRYGKRGPMMKDQHNWTIWQYSETGVVAGIPKPVDLNTLNPSVLLGELRIRN